MLIGIFLNSTLSLALVSIFNLSVGVSPCLDLLVDNYDKLQAIINDLKAIGLVPEIKSSNAQGDQLRARLKISG